MTTGMAKYLIMADSNRCCYTVKISLDKIQALRLCKELNLDREREMIPGARYFVVRDLDGQTWEYVNGLMYRVSYKPELAELEYKEVAL